MLDHSPRPGSTGTKPIRAVLFVRVSSDKQDVARQLDLLKSRAAARGWEVVATLKATVSGSKKMNTARPEVQELLRMAELHQLDLVAVEQVSRLSRIQSQAFEIFERLTGAGVSIFIERYQLETLLDNGKLNPGAHRVFSDQAHEANREVLEHSERVASGIAYARSKRPGRQWGRAPGKSLTDAELVAKPKYRDVVLLLKAGGSTRQVARISQVSKNSVTRVSQAMQRINKPVPPIQ